MISILINISVIINCYSQNENTSEIIISIAEELAADDSDPEAAGRYLEQLNELAEDPVKINSAGESELSRLFFLSDFQVKSLSDYITRTGDIVSVFEIASIPGFDRHTAGMMIPFIDLSGDRKGSPDSIRIRSTLLSNLIFRPGEEDSSSPGPAYKLLTKYRFTAGKLSGGFTTEKDMGEKMFDFLSGYLAYNGTGVIREIVAGDFSARSGQGTVISSGIRTHLSLTAPGYMAARNDIRPYTSTDENRFFRGMAAGLSLGKAGMMLFFSHNSLDAATGFFSDSSQYAEKLYETGIHNTPQTLLRKDAVTETFYGLNLTYNFRYLKTGFCWSESRFSLPFVPDIQDTENLFDFSGSSNRLFSVHFNSLINRILLYSELSFNAPGRYALVQGATIRPSDRLAVNFLYRNYTAGYSSSHGNGPGISSSGKNEEGLLGNITFEAAKHLFISAGCDVSHFPWLTYSCSYPSYGSRTEIRIRYTPMEQIVLDISYNARHTMHDEDLQQGIPQIEEMKNRWLKGQVRYSPDTRFTFLTRIDYRKIQNSGSTGALFLQDISYSLRQFPLTVWLRYCIFSTDDWDSRLYAYENDLLYGFSIPALSGKGTRSCIMVKWEVGRHADLRVKYSLTSLVSGENLSEEKDELKLQFRVWF